jgi:hypothetical protein
MKPSRFTFKTILASAAGVIVILVAGYLIITTAIDTRLSTLEQTIRSTIAEQVGTLSTIAEITARNGADAVTEAIIKDCTAAERGEFEDHLGRLNSGLTRNELINLERLFGRCGTFYAERKAIMVARLSREIEVYSAHVAQLSAVKNEDLRANFKVSQWESLAAEERKQSQLFAELVTLQDSIISTLLSGKSAASPEMQEILQKAREVQETLMVANKQAATIRTELVSI